MNSLHLRIAASTLLLPTVAFAQSQPAASNLSAPAAIAAYFSADLYAKDSGYISEVRADIGDHVKKGQTLAIIDDPELLQQAASARALLAAKKELVKAADANVTQHQAALEVAHKQLTGLQADQRLARLTLKRQEALFSGKAVTDQQIDETRAKADVADATVAVAQAKIAAAQADLKAAQANRSVADAQARVSEADVKRLEAMLAYLNVTAPFDGIITRRLVNPGDLVQAATASRSTTPLFTCQRIDMVRVYCDIPELHAVAIQPGLDADIRVFGLAGRTLHGKVTRISAALDPASRTMRAEIDLPNPTESLRPGMYAQVTLNTATRSSAP